jgi:hypothetical protein
MTSVTHAAIWVGSAPDDQERLSPASTGRLPATDPRGAHDEDCHRHRRLYFFKNRPSVAALVERYQPFTKRFQLQGNIILTSQMQRDALMTNAVDLHQRPVPDKGTACPDRRRT